MLSTPEQHEALFQEILAEMTPERLVEALKPIELPPLSIEIELTEADRQRDKAMINTLLYSAMIIRPEIPTTQC